jgi:hypothetical protein
VVSLVTTLSTLVAEERGVLLLFVVSLLLLAVDDAVGDCQLLLVTIEPMVMRTERADSPPALSLPSTTSPRLDRLDLIYRFHLVSERDYLVEGRLSQVECRLPELVRLASFDYAVDRGGFSLVVGHTAHSDLLLDAAEKFTEFFALVMSQAAERKTM